MEAGALWRPTAAQELLLEAAIGAPELTATRFASWRANRGSDDIDDGSARLLPLLVPRLALLPADDPLLPIIRGYFRRSTWQVQLLRARAGAVIQRFATLGIRSLVLKGGVLGALYYDRPGFRPMGDYDVLVPRESAGEAIRCLVASGWKCDFPVPEALPDVYHSVSFRSPDGLEFDLHWHLLATACERHADDPSWAAAEPFVVNGVPTLALASADLLVVVVAHGAQWAPVPAVRWIADALTVIDRAGAGLEWQRAVWLARRWHVVPQVRHAFDYLIERWGADVPAAVRRTLGELRVPTEDVRSFAFLGRRPGLVDYVQRPWRRYRLRTRDRPAWRALPGFIAYLKVTLRLRSAWALPAESVRRVRQWRRNSRRGLR